MAALQSPRKVGRTALAAAGTSPGSRLGIKAPSGPGGALGDRRIINQYGGGGRSPHPNPAEFLFYH